jgi:DNA invertase Pin-like site-specific DNA recombinase
MPGGRHAVATVGHLIPDPDRPRRPTFQFTPRVREKGQGMSKKKATELIPAVAYLRKSTTEEGHEISIADQRARIGRLRPPREGSKYEIVKTYDLDKGVPGWKRGAKRPDYFKLVQELATTKAKAILVDDMDRFSRSDSMETVHDVQKLREAGVRFIHAVNQGCKDLVEGGAIVPMQIAMEANASHEFSTRLSRRIAEARAKAAADGKRSGGLAPYAMKNDGQGGHNHGDPKHVKVVRQIFNLFVKELKSLNGIANELNARKVPASHGGLWWPATVKELLQRREYRGDFVYNTKKSGQFHIVNSAHQVVPVHRYQDGVRQPWKATAEGQFTTPKAYKPIVTPTLWDAAQKRIATFSLKGSRQRTDEPYALTGILICDHCGRPMYPCHPKGRHRVYRCSARTKEACKLGGKPDLRESVILPQVLRMLGEEISDITNLLITPPEELVSPHAHDKGERESLQREERHLVEENKKAEENWFNPNLHPQMRESLEKKVAERYKRIEEIRAKLSVARPTNPGYNSDELLKLAAWHEDFMQRALTVPVNQKAYLARGTMIAHLMQDRFSEEPAVLADARMIHAALHALGAEVRLRWKAVDGDQRGGNGQPKYTVVGGRFRLGQQAGKVTGKDGVTLHKARVAGQCNDIRDGDRFDNRTGTD